MIVRIFILLAALVLFFIEAAFSQADISNYSLFGNYGLIETPTARFGSDKDISLSVSYMPEKHRVLIAKPLASPELHYNLDLIFLPFLEITGTLIRPLNIKEQAWGIGDRGIKMRLRLLQESEKLPAIVIGVHDPAGANTNNGAVYIVISKKMSITDKIIIDSHLGFGFDITKEFWESTTLFMERGDKNISRLTGLFGGIHIKYKNISLLSEYDTNRINCGVAFSINKYLNVRVVSIDFNSIAYGIGIKLY